MIKSLFLFALCMATSIAYGQSDSAAFRKNAIKINILPPLVSATSEISYERMIRPNMSLVAGIGGNWRGNKSDFVLYSDVDLSFQNIDIKNRYLLVEFRRYLDFCDCKCKKVPPHGFYVGGFLKYNSVGISSDVIFSSNSDNIDTKVSIDYRSLNFGALVGYQINLDHWLIDFEFLGLGYSPRWVELNSSRPLTDDELAQLSDALSQSFSIAGNYKEIELNSSSTKFNFWFLSLRYAVSIGYNF